MISRPRLQTGFNGRLTIVSAPPGFGKTTLLSAWLAANKNAKAAWYALDEDDNNPARFFAYLAASLRTVEPDSVSALDSALEAGSDNPRELTVALLHDLAEFSSKSVVLVLDDYHHITQQPIHDAVAYLIDHLPNNIHLIFISRADPPGVPTFIETIAAVWANWPDCRYSLFITAVRRTSGPASSADKNWVTSKPLFCKKQPAGGSSLFLPIRTTRRAKCNTLSSPNRGQCPAG